MLISGSRFQPPRAETLLEEALTQPHHKKGSVQNTSGGDTDGQESGGLGANQQSAQYKELPSYRALTYQDLTKADKYWRNSSGHAAPVKDIVVIHVCDENRKVTRDFNCRRDILMNNMKYFKSYLSSSESSLDEVSLNSPPLVSPKQTKLFVLVISTLSTAYHIKHII